MNFYLEILKIFCFFVENGFGFEKRFFEIIFFIMLDWEN